MPGFEPLPEPAPEPPAGYLDAVGGQPLLPAARRAWLAAVDQAWGDPARLHHEGRRAGMLLDAARASIASTLGVRPAEVYFTPSGPTAVAVAVEGLLGARREASGRAVVSAVESMAVGGPVHRWAATVDTVPVDPLGRIQLPALATALQTPAAVACVQAANPEVGTRQPLAEAARIARAAGTPLLVHAVQVVGRGPVPVDWDILAASARDWGGPAGVGILAVRADVGWAPEPTRDRGWVVGFPDIPGAAAAAAALEYLGPAVDSEAARAFALVERIRSALVRLDPGLVVTGDPSNRLPHIVTFTCAGTTGEAVVAELGRRGVRVASGSACTADTSMPSQVLAAMGYADEASVRVSLPLGCTADTVDAFLTVLPDALAAARLA